MSGMNGRKGERERGWKREKEKRERKENIE